MNNADIQRIGFRNQLAVQLGIIRSTVKRKALPGVEDPTIKVDVHKRAPQDKLPAYQDGQPGQRLDIYI